MIFRFNFLSIVGLAPTNPKFIPHGNSTSILLIWTAPSPLGDTTGYRISFTAGDRTYGFMDINDTFTNNFTLTNIIKGVKYRMSIAGKSEHFFSNSVAFSGQLYIVRGVVSTYNPRRACAARVTVVVLCVCVCVCVSRPLICDSRN